MASNIHLGAAFSEYLDLEKSVLEYSKAKGTIFVKVNSKSHEKSKVAIPRKLEYYEIYYRCYKKPNCPAKITVRAQGRQLVIKDFADCDIRVHPPSPSRDLGIKQFRSLGKKQKAIALALDDDDEEAEMNSAEEDDDDEEDEMNDAEEDDDNEEEKMNNAEEDDDDEEEEMNSAEEDEGQDGGGGGSRDENDPNDYDQAKGEQEEEAKHCGTGAGKGEESDTEGDDQLVEEEQEKEKREGSIPETEEGKEEENRDDTEKDDLEDGNPVIFASLPLEKKQRLLLQLLLGSPQSGGKKIVLQDGATIKEENINCKSAPYAFRRNDFDISLIETYLEKEARNRVLALMEKARKNPSERHCGTCGKRKPGKGHKISLECHQCLQWHHGACVDMKASECEAMKGQGQWFCPTCSIKT